MKRLILCFLLVLITVTGCSHKSEDDMKSYIRRVYGDYKEVVKDGNDDEDKIVYKVVDKEYNFEYTVTDNLTDFSIDNTKFFEFQNTSSDFKSCYYRKLVDLLKPDLEKLEKDYNVSLTYEDDLSGKDDEKTQGFAKIVSSSKDELKLAEVSKKVNDLFVDKDTRHYFREAETSVYNESDEKQGLYVLSMSRYFNSNSKDGEPAYRMLGVAKTYNHRAEYKNYYEKKFSETGIDENELANVLGSDEVTSDTIVTFYNFVVDDKEFFIADVNVKPSANYYTNYNEVFNSSNKNSDEDRNQFVLDVAKSVLHRFLSGGK